MSPKFRPTSKEGEFEFVSDNPYQCNMNGCIYRELKEEDYLQVYISYQQYSLPWGAINLFLADERAGIMDDEKYLCRFGYFNWDGLYLWNESEVCEIDKSRNELPLYMLLHRSRNVVEAYVGSEQEKMKRVGLFNWEPDKKAELKIGIQVKLNDNAYYNWLYTNFIQISCDITNRDRRLDYFYGVQKDWKWNSVNYFLNSQEMSIDFVRQCGCLSFIKNCINKSKYLEMMIDQYYLPDREEYRYVHHYHQNLIYGYDDRRKVFLLEGYTNHGRLTKTEITYRDLKYVMRKEDIKYLTVVEYKQAGYRYYYYHDYVVMMLKEYLEGINSSYHLTNLVPQTERVYGIKVYQEFLTEAGMEVFLSDKRISHLLYEHKVCMEERIHFLGYKGFLSHEEEEQAAEQAALIKRKMFNVRNLVIKYEISGGQEIIHLIQLLLKEIEQEERNMLQKVLSIFDDLGNSTEILPKT